MIKVLSYQIIAISISNSIITNAWQQSSKLVMEHSQSCLFLCAAQNIFVCVARISLFFFTREAFAKAREALKNAREALFKVREALSRLGHCMDHPKS